MKLGQKLLHIKPAVIRHLVARSFKPYERLLQYIRAHGDIWIASQGEYIAWWQKRENATLKVKVANGLCQVYMCLENGVIEKFPGEFFDSSITVPCPETKFSGEVWITIDSALEQKDVLIEILKREGILNFRVATEGEFMLPRQEMGPLLEKIEAEFHHWFGSLFKADIHAIRQIIIDKLAACNLPLFRIWYHPQLNGFIPQAVFSPRYDVDRAITNLAHIRALEEKYNVPSTLYIRPFGPFYGDKEIKELAAKPWCSEIALHGEFVTQARQYGDEFKAAAAEKAHLEILVERSVMGVSLHGGELTNNKTKNTHEVIQKAKFLYDTTHAFQDYFPFRVLVQGQLSEAYGLAHTLGDINIPANRDYDRVFYEWTKAKMDQIREQNGVFVFMLHPEYFGFYNYLAQPGNWLYIVKFFWYYFKQLHS